MEKFPFVWKKGAKPEDPLLQKQREEKAIEQLSQRRHREISEWSHELPLTPERKEMIEAAALVFEKQFEVLGIPWKPEFSLKLFHFFDQKGFDAQFPESAGNDGFHGKYDITAVVEEKEKGETLLTLFHEMAHMASAQKYMLTEEEEKLLLYRVGYAGIDTNGRNGEMDEKKTHFDAFNEGVVEMSALRMAIRYKETLAEQLNIDGDLEELANKGHAYKDCVALVGMVIEKLAKWEGSEELAVWKRIEKGQYTGEMMWMRDIDTLFGSGSLRVLDAYVADPGKDVAVIERNKKILRYFKTDDLAEREQLQTEIY